jgi:hypothetical protein
MKSKSNNSIRSNNLIRMGTQCSKIFWIKNRPVSQVVICILASSGMRFFYQRLINIKYFQSIKMLNILTSVMGWYQDMELILIKVLRGIIMKIGLLLFWILWNPRVKHQMPSGLSAAFLVFMMAMGDLRVLIFSEIICISLL